MKGRLLEVQQIKKIDYLVFLFVELAAFKDFFLDFISDLSSNLKKKSTGFL